MIKGLEESLIAQPLVLTSGQLFLPPTIGLARMGLNVCKAGWIVSVLTAVPRWL